MKKRIINLIISIIIWSLVAYSLFMNHNVVTAAYNGFEISLITNKDKYSYGEDIDFYVRTNEKVSAVSFYLLYDSSAVEFKKVKSPVGTSVQDYPEDNLVRVIYNDMENIGTSEFVFTFTAKRNNNTVDFYLTNITMVTSDESEVFTRENIIGGDSKITVEIDDNQVPDNSPRPTQTNSPSPTQTNSPSPTQTNSPRPTQTNRPSPTQTNSPRPTQTNSPSPTQTNSPSPTQTNSPRPTQINRPSPTQTNSPRPTQINNPSPTQTNSPKPTQTNSPSPKTSGIGKKDITTADEKLPHAGQSKINNYLKIALVASTAYMLFSLGGLIYYLKYNN